MSFTDPSPDVQPDEGQGEGGTSDAPYAEYLNRIPEELRGDVEPVFKEWDSNVGRKFQEAADFRKQWEPLQDTGVHQLSPEEVAWLVQFRGALDDPQTMQQWWNGYAQENGLTQPASEPEAQSLDDFGFQDPAQLQSLVDQATGPLKQQLEAIQGYIQEQQQIQEQGQLLSKLEGQVAEIEKKNGKPFTEQEKEILARFASRYDDAETAIPRGYEDMTAFINGIEKQTLQAKTEAPAPAEGGGIPNVKPEKYSRIDDPNVKEQAMQFLRNNR